MTLQKNLSLQENNSFSKDTGFTPHQLVLHQVENFDYHVSDEDMENMKISTDISDEKEIQAGEETAAQEKDDEGARYNVLD